MWFVFLAIHFLTAFGAGASTDALLSAVQNADDCPSCLALLGAFSGNRTHRICIGLGASDPDVCAGIIAREGPILAHDLRQISSTGQTAESSATLFSACRRRSKLHQIHLLPRLDDSPAVPTVPAGPNGNSHCDSTITLADTLLEEVDRLNPRFSIFHRGWEVTTDLKAFDVQMAAKLTAPIFPSLGNHDSAPVNAFARTTSNTANNSQFVFDTQSAGWEHWIGTPAAFEVDHHSGAYSAKVPGMDLRIIAVNTHYWLYDSDVLQPDPNGIIAFAVDALQAAEDAGDRAWIIGHIPLGKEDTLIDQSNYYDQVLQRYKNTIAGQFFGHSHKDQFEVAYSNYSEQTAGECCRRWTDWTALTPTTFKMYEIDPDTFEVMDVRVMFTNISEPSFQIRPQWGLYYSARETYGPLVGLSPNEPLSPAFWHNLTEVFAANETAFQMFNTFISRGGAVTACDAPSGCQNTTICDMRAFRSQDNCDTPAEGFSLRKRASATHDSGECEGTGLAHILSRMVLAA
ncbi:sphingomyelin phosphodiesterase [Mycena olivaceomarginata]|nr:sphingomyelin phosphodiesterase [Mycena olivaceomarginata]